MGSELARRVEHKPSSEGLAELFDHVTRNWDNEKAHEAFLQACEAEGQLAFAAARYRNEKDHGPEARASSCEAQLQKITALALSSLHRARSSVPDRKRNITLVACVVSPFLILACVYALTQ